MRLTLKVHYDGQSFDVTTNLGTVVAWERRYKRKASEMATAIGAEDLAFLAWEAARQSGHTMPASFDDFIARCDEVPEVVESEQARPTRGEPTDTL